MFGLVGAILLTMRVYAMPTPQRRETCPGAVYFIKHGEHVYWTKHKRLLCTIGAHDFYGDLPSGKRKARVADRL